MDLDTKRSDPDGPTSGGGEIKKCAHCGTSKTPLWRGGPAGPKSLCNACGIRNRKKIRVISGIRSEKGRAFSSTKKSGGSGSTSSSNASTITSTMTSCSSSSSKLRRGGGPKTKTLNQRLVSLGREVMMGRSTVGKRTPRVRKLGEEEQAAVLLMAISYGSVYV